MSDRAESENGGFPLTPPLASHPRNARYARAREDDPLATGNQLFRLNALGMLALYDGSTPIGLALARHLLAEAKKEGRW